MVGIEILAAAANSTVTAAASGGGMSLGTAVAAIGAGVAIAGGAIGTGVAQSGIGSAGLGLIAEKKENLGIVLLFFVIPETLLIFGFVIAILIMLTAGII